MATIRNIVQSAVASITDAPEFMWGTPHDFNVRLDDLAGDTVVLMLPSDAVSLEAPKLNKFHMQHSVVLGVLKKSALDDDYESTRALILEEMKTLSKEILARIMAVLSSLPEHSLEDFIISELGDFNAEGIHGFFNLFDMNADGVQLAMRINVKESSTVCWAGSGKISVSLL